MLCKLFTYLLLYLSAFLSIRLFHFEARDRKRQPNLALVFGVFILFYTIFCDGCMFSFVVLDLVFPY